MHAKFSITGLLASMMICTLSSCLKETSPSTFTLPEATRTGLNTFGFEYGSEVFVNYGKVCFLTSGCRENTNAYFYTNDGQMRVQADRVLKQNGSLVSTEGFSMYLETGFRGVRVYDSQRGDLLSMAYDISKNRQEVIYVLDPQNPVASVALTRLDSTAGVLSGTFNAKLFRRDDAGFAVDPTDSFIVRNGRFDIKYK
jgi:hypothetical protein